MLESLKNRIRIVEARLTRRTTQLKFRSHSLSFYQSQWWVSESQPLFDEEILPYFAAIAQPPDEIQCIVDAGAATGLFSIAAAQIYRTAQLHLFEPSARQRILLERNLRLNAIARQRAVVYEQALWEGEGSQSFRTIGAMSSIELVSHLAGRLKFAERVRTISLDRWCEQVRPKRLDLVKMDIEGAEIEALRGARGTLSRFKPELLVMAYHPRDGARTFERCANELSDLGYRVTELPHADGFLHGVAG